MIDQINTLLPLIGSIGIAITVWWVTHWHQQLIRDFEQRIAEQRADHYRLREQLLSDGGHYHIDDAPVDALMTFSMESITVNEAGAITDVVKLMKTGILISDNKLLWKDGDNWLVWRRTDGDGEWHLDMRYLDWHSAYGRFLTTAEVDLESLMMDEIEDVILTGEDVFALAILSGDESAVDAVRDILKL